MCNKVKSKHSFAVTSTKRVTVFQASLQVVTEEARAQWSKKDNNHSIFQGSNHLHEGDAVNTNDALI